MYFRARYYDPQLGEFISRDPLGYVDGMSLYRGYFAPGAVDPFGLQEQQTCDGKKARNCQTKTYAAKKIGPRTKTERVGGLDFSVTYSLEVKSGTFTECEICCGDNDDWSGKCASYDVDVKFSVKGSASARYTWNGLFGLKVFQAGADATFSLKASGDGTIKGASSWCPPKEVSGTTSFCFEPLNVSVGAAASVWGKPQTQLTRLPQKERLHIQRRVVLILTLVQEPFRTSVCLV